MAIRIFTHSVGRESGMEDLKTLPGDALSEATGVIDQGQIVGVSFAAGFANPRAFLWQNGVMTDLNRLIPAGSSLYLLSANDINNEGVITGQACVLINGVCTADNETPAFLAIPQDPGNFNEAGTAGAQAAGSAGFGVAVPENIRQQILRRHGLTMHAGMTAKQ